MLSAGNLRLLKALVCGFAINIVRDLSMIYAKINYFLKNQNLKKFKLQDIGNVKTVLKTQLNASVAKRRELF